ncbi:MAG: extracellular solute-binding protein [Candidatus Nanopelagicaceae bacterium]|nr:extracellular solute-binding protein [Candidatus Nanopelagicaceae bacterium]
MNRKGLGVLGVITSAALAISVAVMPGAHAAGKNFVIWADDARTPLIRTAAAAWAKSHNLTLTVVTKDFGKVRDDLVTAAPKGLGPDIIVGAHDWVGQLAASGVIARLYTINTASFAKSSIDAFTYNGGLYGVPYAVENIALFTNLNVVSAAPKTFEELEKTYLSLKAAGKVKGGLLVPAGDAYHNYPLFSGLGGYIFGTRGKSLNVNDLGVASAKLLSNASKIDTWVSEGLIDKGTAYDFQLWYDDKAPYMITGPWNLATVKKSGIPYAITAVPPIAGNPTRPFVGVQGFMMSKFTKNKMLSMDFMTKVIASDDFQIAMYKLGSRLPALLSAATKVSSDSDVVAFGQYGATGVPMPNIPEMSSVWGDLGNAWTTVVQGKSKAADAFTLAAKNIKKALA